nr:PREDICTED: uncharacterized protein LOC105670991 isoform X2 [Linepithema humile]
MKRVIERRRGPKGIQAPSEQHCGIVTTWRTVRSETPLGVVGVVAVVAADPSPPLSNTYAPPKADFTMDCTTIPTEARLPMISPPPTKLAQARQTIEGAGEKTRKVHHRLVGVPRVNASPVIHFYIAHCSHFTRQKL